MYDKPTQGVAQVTASPVDGKGLMIMYAGLGPKSMLKLCDLKLYDLDCSYVIFDGDQQLASGCWEDTDANLCWISSSRTTAVLRSNQQ